MKRSDYFQASSASVVSVVPVGGPTIGRHVGAGAGATNANAIGGRADTVGSNAGVGVTFSAEIGHSYFWNKPLRGAIDYLSTDYVIEGLQSIDITLETLPTNEGYRQIAISFVDHLVTTALRSLRAGYIIAPPGVGFEARLEEFSLSWRLIGVGRAAVLRDAQVLADLAVDLTPGRGPFLSDFREAVATRTALAGAVQIVPVVILVVVGCVGHLTTAVLVVLVVIWAVLDLGFKLCVSSHLAQCSDNQNAFDAFATRLARLASKNLPLAQFAPAIEGVEGLADEGEHSVVGAEDEAEEIGQMFTQPPFLLAPDDALQRKNSIDAMLGEADDDEGCVVLRVRGFPKVSLEIGMLFPHLLFVVTGLDGKIALWTDGAAAMTGFTAADAEGMKISSFLFGDNSAAVYVRMVEAARTQGDYSTKPLALANATYGHITVKASVNVVLHEDTKEPLGYVLVASSQSERYAKQHLFHQYFLGELASELHFKFDEFGASGDLGRCGQILEAMRWNFLRDLASSAKEWHSVYVHGLLNEALRDRHRQVDVRVDPRMPEQIVCDQITVSKTITRALGLLQGRVNLTIARQSVASTNLLSKLLIAAGPAKFLTESNLRDLQGLAATVGGEASFTSTQKIELVFPFLTEGASTNLLVDEEEAVERGGPPVPAAPITILLFEKHAVYRHNISTIAFAGGHLVRIVEQLGDAMRALSEGGGAAQFGCAMIDIDMREVSPLLAALRAARVYLIEMTEHGEAASAGAATAEGDEEGREGRVVLSKPVSKAEIEMHLSIAAKRVMSRRREEDRIIQQRAILSTQRNSPWVKGKKLGHGAFANVFEATSTLTGGKMAVKMIRLRRGKDEAEKAKTLLNEIKILCQLQHPNIIHYFYCEPTEETLNLFMELATGGSLQDLLQREKVLPESRVSYYTKELLQAVRYLHDHDIIHRDIKPGNILLSGRGNDEVKLTDFGTATQEEASDTQGTIEYMAPEVLGVGSRAQQKKSSLGEETEERGTTSEEGTTYVPPTSDSGGGPAHRTYSKECDIWSVGCVVCKCLGIERPSRDGTLFGGLGVPSIFPSHISAAAREFVNLCLQDEPSERATAGTLLLHDFIVNPPSAAAAVPPSTIPTKKAATAANAATTAAASSGGPLTIGSDDGDEGGGDRSGGGGVGEELGRRGSVMSVWTDDEGDDPSSQQQLQPTAPPTTTSLDTDMRAGGRAQQAQQHEETANDEDDGGPLSIASDD